MLCSVEGSCRAIFLSLSMPFTFLFYTSDFTFSSISSISTCSYYFNRALQFFLRYCLSVGISFKVPRAALAHNNYITTKLCKHIIFLMTSSSKTSFPAHFLFKYEFIQHCSFHPNQGYYARGRHQNKTYCSFKLSPLFNFWSEIEGWGTLEKA